MAAQTLTAASNFDGPSLMLGLNNGEAITVNGGALTIDSDVRWNQNAAVFGSITVSATLGGSVLFEGRNVWELPYSAATGSVPTQAALGSNGVTGGTSGATGELLRVWADGSLTPTAAGGAMPAAGWVKLRSKTGTFQAGEVVTLPGGATITISSAGKRSWLHIVGAQAGTITIPRLADVKWRGEWYELGTTNGADDQTFQFPVADACPAIWVEKYAGAYVALGDAGLEPWLNAGPRWGAAPQQVATDVRGKYFGQSLTTGVVTIAQRASNACGFKPAAGLRVFVPNLILSSSTSANWAANTINATLTTRYKTATDQGGVADMQGLSSNWYVRLVSASVAMLTSVAALDAIFISNIATRPACRGVAIGLGVSTAGYNPITLTTLYAGIEMRRVRASRAAQGTHSIWTDVVGLDGEDVQMECFGAAGSAVRTVSTLIYLRRVSGELRSSALVGVRYMSDVSQQLKIVGTQYADLLVGDTSTSAGMSAVDVSAGSQGVIVEGFSNFGGLLNVHPYNSICAFAAGISECELLNVGSPVTPYDCGTVNPMASAVSASGGVKDLVRRVYIRNNRSEPVSVNNTVDKIEMINVWGDATQNQTLDANNVSARGCKWSPVPNGQSAVYGTHWQDQFTGDTSGAVTVTCNEPTDATVGEVVASFAAGSGWTAAGGASMATVGDTVTWTMPYFALGHTALANSAPTITGTNVANHLVEFQADTGSGWSAWAELTDANLAAVGAINPATGVRLRVRATVTTASASNLLTNIRIDTVTDATSQQIQYPLPKLAALTLTGLQPGSDIVILQAGTETELANVDANGSTTYAYDYDTTTTVDIGVFKVGFVPFYVRGFALAATDAVLPIAQVADRNYLNP